jgi:hypothetical protein
LNRLRAITIGGALLAALVLGVFAYLIADAQSKDRENVEQRFRDVARVSAAVTDGIFQAALQGAQSQASTNFAGTVDQSAVQAYVRRGQLRYAAVLDHAGRRLAATPGTPPSGGAVDVAIETGKARFSDVMGRGKDAVVEWAIPFQTPEGRRLLVQGSPASAFEEFLTASLGKLPNFADAETVMLDGKGLVLGGTRLSTPVGERLEDGNLLEALAEKGAGAYGGNRFFASGAITGSPFKIVLDTSESKLYESITGEAVSWIIFAAFALMALLGLYLLRRSTKAAAELERRELNERHAVEINDNIIQGLALAKYQLEAGEGEASAAQVAETLREAQRLVSGLLGDAEVQAGQLRREIAAETTRPDQAPESTAGG